MKTKKTEEDETESDPVDEYPAVVRKDNKNKSLGENVVLNK